MVRPKQEEIEEQLKRQELDSDGSESASGTNPVPGEDSTADVDTMISEVIGNDPEEEEEGFNIGDAVNNDEKTIRDKEINDYTDDDEELDDLDDDLAIEREKRDKENARTDDPYDTFGEDDDADTDTEE